MAAVDDHHLLAEAVRSYADVDRLSDHDRDRLASWLSASVLPTTFPPAAQHRRRRLLVAATAAAVVLVPWLAVLAVTLPDQHRAYEWRVAWVGFDVALVLAFSATAWFGWRHRQAVITALLVTATLLLCDAWFDVVLSWGSRDQRQSIITALVGEIPFAAFLLMAYHRLVRGLASLAWRHRGLPGETPPLRQLPLLLTARRPDSRTSTA